MATTLLALQTNITENSQRTSSADVTLSTSFINDGYNDVCAECNLGETNVTKNLTSGQTKYSLTSDWSLTGVLAINELRYIQSGATANFAIVPAVSLREVLDLNSAAVTGWTRVYAWQGADTIQLAPAPITGDTITLYYVPSPTALSAAGDVPSAIPGHYQERLLASYGLSRMYELEDPVMAAQYTVRYKQHLNDLKNWMLKRQGNTARGTIVGYPSRPNRPVHDRSTYYSGMN